jgi:hypothetical protein
VTILRTNYFTSEPETPARLLICPICDHPLHYQQTVFAGITPRERWDFYTCRDCGPFKYRERTRKLERVVNVP